MWQLVFALRHRLIPQEEEEEEEEHAKRVSDGNLLLEGLRFWRR